jgi:glycosyltransferase involved in cell wall biosynthesis
MSDRAPLVSVVVAAYVATEHQARLLDETLATVDAQEHRGYEVVVVDDGSPLPVAPIVARHERARCVRQANAGPAVARNVGVRDAAGEFLVFLDADDHLHPHALAAGLARFAERPECAMVVGPRDDMWYDGTVSDFVPTLPPADRDLYEVLLDFTWYIIPPSSCMVRRAAFDAVGGFRDPWGADDLDFYLRVVRHGPVWCYGGPPVTRYRRYPESSSRDGARMLRSVRAVYERQREIVAGDPALEAAFERGLARLVDIFQRALIENVAVRLAAGDHAGAHAAARLLAEENPALAAAALDPALRHAALAGAAA